MPSRPSGATMPSAMSATSPTRFWCEQFIAPGWNAVIWLSSRSVMMNACAVYVPGNRAHAVASRSPSAARRSRYGAPSSPMRRHHHRLAAESPSGCTRCCRRSRPTRAASRRSERHRQHVRLLGQDVAGEAVGKHHDGVVGERTADQGARAGHGRWGFVNGVRGAKCTPAPRAGAAALACTVGRRGGATAGGGAVSPCRSRGR